MTRLTDYFELTKPRLTLGNLLIAAAAFVFGAHTINPLMLVYMVAGLFAIIGSGCALNNVYDRGIDARMTRTKGRALPAGRIAPYEAIGVGVVLLVVGSILLWLTGPLALGAALVGWIFYVFIYTPLKHISGLAFFAGAVAGAMPPVVGYAAASHRLDLAAVVLFVAMYLWQLPHFMAIAYYRFKEYTAAGVPLLVRREPTEAQRTRARSVFRFSLVVLLLMCAALIILRP